MNKLQNFHIKKYYKPHVQNTVTDTLNRYSLVEKHLRKYSETCSLDEVKLTFDGAISQTE